LEKKNGGNRMRPKIGIVVRTCHIASATTATSNCRERSLILDTLKLLSSK
jgi:hypothetical protein